jgi:methylase of polypeptide subunit release factors
MDIFMHQVKQVTEKKANGVHFTPHQLACFVARRIIKAVPSESMDSMRVLDPACGDGELLLAFAEVLPPKYLERTVFVGVESDDRSLVQAKRRFEKCSIQQFELEKADFLELCKRNMVQRSLFDGVLPHRVLSQPTNVIIANPPYVRTQVLGAAKAQELATLFGLSGRVDLYQAFLVAMTRQLAPGGILGVITSNRFLSTQAGASTRAFLSHEYDIIELFDLGDTKLFDAAVLPAVFIGRKLPSPASITHLQRKAHSSRADTARFVRIYTQTTGQKDSSHETLKPLESVYSVLEVGSDGNYFVAGQHFKVSTGVLSLPASPDEPWSMVTSNETAWLEVVNGHTTLRISDVAKVRVGVKTTADEVFIRTNWNSLPEEIRPEEQLLHILLSQDNAVRWVLNKEHMPLRRVLYTHTIKDGKRVAIDLARYPRAAAYFEQHRERLSRRTYITKAKRNWYEIWVPQHPSLWVRSKIVFPDISAQPKFYYDDRGYLVDGDCYWITLDELQQPDLLFLIVGIANSQFMTHYHDLVFNNKLYSGRRRYLTQYVEKYPLPDPSTRYSREIMDIVKDLIFSSLPDSLRKQKERVLELLVAQAFGVEPLLSD